MQRISFFIIFALSLSCVFTTYTTENFNRSPLSVADDTELGFVNSSFLRLTSIGESLYLTGLNITTFTRHTSADPWDLWLREIDTETLEVGRNISTHLILAPYPQLHSGFAYSVILEMDDIPQIRVYQQSVLGAAPLPAIQLSRNLNSSFTPQVITTLPVDSIIYVFYYSAEKTVNVTGFEIGGNLVGREFTLTSNFSLFSLSAATGEALAKGTVYAFWLEDVKDKMILKEGRVNLIEGSFDSKEVIGYIEIMVPIKAFATDSQVYGGIFVIADQETKHYYINTNINKGITYLTKTTSMFTRLADVTPYGEYFVLLWEDVNLTSFTTSISYEIWKEDGTDVYKPKTNFLTFDSNSSHYEFVVPGKGLFSLVYDNAIYPEKLISNIKVGQVLGNSHLGTLAGFILATLGVVLFI